MSNRSATAFAHTLESRAPVLEPLIVIAIVSLLTSWAIQPYIVHSLSQQGALAQGAAQAALWLAGVLAPISAFFKALAAALVCWACAIYLDVRIPLVKLVSVFCMAEVLFSLRDLTLWAVLAMRGLDGIRTTADLLVAFGINAFVHPASVAGRIATGSWDMFTFAWAILAYWMLRAAFKTDARSAACLAAVVFCMRVLFAAASQLYSV
jgi:hypothetical protein